MMTNDNSAEQKNPPAASTKTDIGCNVKENSATNHLIINIGRQLGSGGHDIGHLLAERFSARYLDRELLNLAARESGLSEHFLEQNDESKSFFRTFLQMPGGLAPAMGIASRPGFSQDSFFQLQSDTIRHAAEEGPCVFVGRCADYVLRDIPTCINIFISAPLPFRIGRVAKKHGCTDEEARHIIEKGENRRASYYNYYTGKQWGHSSSYHLCIDSSILGIQGTATLIAHFIEQRNYCNT